MRRVIEKSNQFHGAITYATYAASTISNYLTPLDRRREKRGESQLAPTWWAYAILKFIRDNGLSKGGLANRIGKNQNTVSRWLYEGVIPPKGTIGLIERTWHADGYFARVRPEAEQWALRRGNKVLAREYFAKAVQHSPTVWMELDDLLRETGVPMTPSYPVPYEVACELLAAAEAELEHEADSAVREQIEMEIAAWKMMYGCDD